ncbi:MAG: hypothetical protein DRN30_05605 [Thermoplasmata archaeon]|nr:methyltransferase [Euryarchaeota archaeon]RLF64289.1 MAG: hypothetical protein DRN30_05605 [Thermoplasmata archaeon]
MTPLGAYALAIYMKLMKLLRFQREYEIEGIRIVVYGGVFDPKFSISTLALMKNLKFRGKRVLEIGCGTGIISIFLEKMGNYVVATEIDEEAAFCALMNARKNGSKIDIIITDLARGIKGPFDVVVSNPPYFKGPERLSRAIFSQSSPYEALVKEARRLNAEKLYTTVSNRSQYFENVMKFSPRFLDKVKLPREEIYVLEIDIRS